MVELEKREEPEMEIEHGEVKTKKIHRKAWEATTKVTKPFPMDFRIIGTTEAHAIERLKKFFNET